jgi:hypothetical protein
MSLLMEDTLCSALTRGNSTDIAAGSHRWDSLVRLSEAPVRTWQTMVAGSCCTNSSVARDPEVVMDRCGVDGAQEAWNSAEEQDTMDGNPQTTDEVLQMRDVVVNRQVLEAVVVEDQWLMCP